MSRPDSAASVAALRTFSPRSFATSLLRSTARSKSLLNSLPIFCASFAAFRASCTVGELRIPSMGASRSVRPQGMCHAPRAQELRSGLRVGLKERNSGGHMNLTEMFKGKDNEAEAAPQKATDLLKSDHQKVKSLFHEF